jgi:hypothetical protein
MSSDTDNFNWRSSRSLQARVIWGFTFACAIALSAFLVINATKANSVAFGSVWFLAILPAYLCAFICHVGDPERSRPKSFYWTVPLVFGLIVVTGSALILREGVICLIMLAPVWLGSGWLGAFLMRGRQKKPVDPAIFNSSLLLLPLLAGALESQIPITPDAVTVTRQINIRATPAEIWPFAVSNAHIPENEGIWTFSQNIAGLPRPRATKLTHPGTGGVRTAYWGPHINFDEIITQWQPGRQISWAFSFTNSSVQDFTDRHIAPDGQFLKIDTGGYTLTPLSADTTLLTLHTRYFAKTHVNAYAQLWGEVFLGDTQNNILAIIKQRAERRHASLPE